MKLDSLYICPWRLDDPLCRSQSLSYLVGLAAAGYKIGLITFESGVLPLSEAESKDRSRFLESNGITWVPVHWNLGGARASLSNLQRVFRVANNACREFRPRLVHARSSVPGFFGAALSKIWRTVFLYDADSLLSLEYVETGHVETRSAAYRYLKFCERMARRRADRIIVLTERLKSDYRTGFGIRVPIDVIPCCVDTEKYKFNLSARSKVRKRLGIGDEKVLVYVGKIGNRYLVQEAFVLLAALKEIRPSSRLLVVSTESSNSFESLAVNSGIDMRDWIHVAAQPEEVPDLLSASDAGIALIRPMLSEQGSSPIKIAEYLSCGLPIVVTNGIGDISMTVRKENVGCVVEQTDRGGLSAAAKRLDILWNQDEAVMKKRCRKIAENRYSLRSRGIPTYQNIYSQLLPQGPVANAYHKAPNET